MDEKEKPSPEVAKAEDTKTRIVWGDHNLCYRYVNNGYGIVGRNCQIEISIITDMPFSEAIQEFVKASEAVCEDLSQRNTAEGECSRSGQLCKFDKPFDRMVVYQTKEAAEQASKERIKAFPYGTPINKIFRSTSEAFCDSLLAKIESHCNLAEINEMVRTLSYFEKTDTLPEEEKLNQIAVAFGRYVEEEVKKRSNLSGEPTFELTDSIRCLHRLSVILWDMLNAKLPIHKCR